MLKITHSSGFFSNCSYRLYEIIKYFNQNNKVPDTIDSTEQFKLYKPHCKKDNDITNDYFINNNNLLEYKQFIDFHWLFQFIDYNKLNYKVLTPFIDKYFTPTEEIYNIISTLETKYNIDYQNTCVLFHRGNDKITESNICNYNETIEKANIIYNKDNNIRFLIQSDEIEFINTMREKFPNNIYFKQEIRAMTKCLSSVDLATRDIDNNNINYKFSKNFLAITIIMSRCKYIVCGAGNCSLWIMFYRKNANNIFQFIENKWCNNLL
jgi:hypothetical protein